jgi:hypothetical protein
MLMRLPRNALRQTFSGSRVNINLTLPAMTHKALRRIAEERRTSVRALIRSVIDGIVDMMEKANDARQADCQFRSRAERLRRGTPECGHAIRYNAEGDGKRKP